LKIDVLHGSVAMQLMWGEIFIRCVVANRPQNILVKDF